MFGVRDWFHSRWTFPQIGELEYGFGIQAHGISSMHCISILRMLSSEHQALDPGGWELSSHNISGIRARLQNLTENPLASPFGTWRVQPAQGWNSQSHLCRLAHDSPIALCPALCLLWGRLPDRACIFSAQVVMT